MYTIEDGISVPKTVTRSAYPFADMSEGQSFLIPAEDTAAAEAAKLRVTAASYRFGKNNGCKFAVRHVEGGVRVWRTA